MRIIRFLRPSDFTRARYWVASRGTLAGEDAGGYFAYIDWWCFFGITLEIMN